MTSTLLVMASSLESLAAVSLVSHETNHGDGFPPVAMTSDLEVLASKLDVMASNLLSLTLPWYLRFSLRLACGKPQVLSVLNISSVWLCLQRIQAALYVILLRCVRIIWYLHCLSRLFLK